MDISYNITEEICKTFPFQRGHKKLIVLDYLMVKDENFHDYYWCCEYKDTLYCKSRAITKILHGQHTVRKFIYLNPFPITSATSVSNIADKLKI